MEENHKDKCIFCGSTDLELQERLITAFKRKVWLECMNCHKTMRRAYGSEHRFGLSPYKLVPYKPRKEKK